jgi:hypothetical protein
MYPYLYLYPFIPPIYFFGDSENREIIRDAMMKFFGGGGGGGGEGVVDSDQEKMRNEEQMKLKKVEFSLDL